MYGISVTKKSQLQQEIQQSPPFRSSGQEAALGILRTADALRRHFAPLFEPFGITQQQYNVLRILRGAGDEGLATLSIGDRMVERTPGITRLIDRLEKKGWVLRRRSASDRRCVYCTITESGLDLLRELDEPVDRSDEVMVNALSEEEQAQMIRLLDKVRADLRL